MKKYKREYLNKYLEDGTYLKRTNLIMDLDDFKEYEKGALDFDMIKVYDFCFPVGENRTMAMGNDFYLDEDFKPNRNLLYMPVADYFRYSIEKLKPTLSSEQEKIK